MIININNGNNLKNQQLRLENRIMQRPPRPLIKSAQLFPFSQIRKVLTPDYPQHQREIAPALPNEQIKSMRDASVTADMHRSLNQVENVEYLQISKTSNTANSKPNPNILSGCSFKIRNFAYSKSRGIKQNTIPLKPNHKPSASSINPGSSVKCIQIQDVQQIMLKCYPYQLQLTQVGSKIAYHKVKSMQTDEVELFDEWALIISQGLFSGSFLQQINLMKLKNLVQNCKRYHYGLSIILRLHNQRNIGQIINKINQKCIDIQYIIWGKHKYVQTVNAYDVTDLIKHKKINRFIVFEDAHQVIKHFYYHCKDTNGEIKDQDKIKQCKLIDYKSKYTYLKFNGLPNLMKFAQKFRISINNDQILTEKQGHIDATDSLFYLKQIKQKIRIASHKKNIKIIKNPQRRISEHKSLKNSCDLSSKEIEIDKNQQFKKKIIQYAKILQEQHKLNQQRSRSIQKKITQKPQVPKAGPLKLVSQRAQTPSNSKSSHQIVSELLKNNVLIHKQILKYQQKTIGINIQLNPNFL